MNPRFRLSALLLIVLSPSVARATDTPGRAACVQAGLERAVEASQPLSAEDLLLIQRALEGEFGYIAAELRPDLRFFAYLEKESNPQSNSRFFTYQPNSLEDVLRFSSDMSRVPEPQRTRWTETASKRLAEMLDEEGTLYLNLRHIHGAYAKALALARAAKIPESQQKDMVRKISAGLARELASRSPLAGAYEPKLYQFAKRVVRQEIGLQSEPLTDLIITRSEGRPGFKIVSTDPIESADRHSARDPATGLHILNIDEVTPQSLEGEGGKVLVSNRIQWKTAGRTYRAEYEAILGPHAKDVAPAIPKLDFDSQWKDGKYVGLVMPGKNMGDFGPSVLDEYKSYYRDAGFRFQKAKPVADFKKFLQEEIESGRLDYWLKEAHSEGNDRAVTRLVNKGSIVTGTKKLPDGREERIHLYYASTDPGHEGISLSYAEVARWLGRREQEGSQAQLAYFDTSCFGLSTACHLLTEAATPKLVVIGSQTQAETFTNEPESPLLHVLNGIRGHLSFGQIREKMAENSESFRRNLENTYRFPDELQWQTWVQGGVKRLVNVRATVTDSEGRPYSIEDGRD